MNATSGATLVRTLVSRSPRVRRVRRAFGVEEAARRGLMGGVLPLWLGAGLADWVRHRQTGIERNAGTKESVIHALMMAEAGVPVTLGLFCEVNAGVLAACGGALGVHSLTAYWDVSYAEQHREVTPVEQHIHSLLEVVPLMATGFLAVLYWDQARSLAGRGERPDFRIRLKRDGLVSWKARAALIGAMTVFGALPYAEEMIRCVRASSSRKAGEDEDEPTP
ncbi:diguanylate cyclase [Spirillospora sp. NPDC049652]